MCPKHHNNVIIQLSLNDKHSESPSKILDHTYVPVTLGTNKLLYGALRLFPKAKHTVGVHHRFVGNILTLPQKD